MVESGESTLSEDLQRAIDQALRYGMDAEAIARMVAERALTLNGVARNGLTTEAPPEDTGDVIYEPGELPDGLIDLPSAAKKYGIPVGTLRAWVHRGKLPRCGRLKARAAGGGYIVTTQAGIEYCRDHPRKGGRPKRVTT